MTAQYPASFDVTQPIRFDRRHVFLRLGIMLVLGFLGMTMGEILGVVYVLLPVAAAVLIARHGPVEYLNLDGPRVAGALRWLIAAVAYMLFLTDRIPGRDGGESIRYEIAAEGAPSLGGALLRLLYSLPMVLLVVVFGIVSALLWLVSAVTILARETQPRAVYGFQRGYVRWMARLAAYHGSLVQAYPTMDFETGDQYTDSTVART